MLIPLKSGKLGHRASALLVTATDHRPVTQKVLILSGPEVLSGPALIDPVPNVLELNQRSRAAVKPNAVNPNAVMPSLAKQQDPKEVDPVVVEVIGADREQTIGQPVVANVAMWCLPVTWPIRIPGPQIRQNLSQRQGPRLPKAKPNAKGRAAVAAIDVVAEGGDRGREMEIPIRAMGNVMLVTVPIPVPPGQVMTRSQSLSTTTAATMVIRHFLKK
ncbi:MAG: hypothetical protein SGJ20_22120 [Planctomycetota bacterium]|nr:hypothetical protein [Planctomycetota bacterium]